ncbi:MAG: DUF86 domain-containing protein [Candidatus Methanoperedens sp.]|nr:DUF86 domain-containing protein [Candidatus Methanoperedens sp.]MCZ7370033.1 DUF86 domain-containing protein [Candidatus Methanoperedens sp.]
MREVRERLLDILEAIERIEKYANRGRDAFEHDELIQTWIVHHLQIIGEAARALPDNFRDKYPDIPWSKIIGMRNILVHNYFGIDVDVVWAVIVNELPDLKEKTMAILKEE